MKSHVPYSHSQSMSRRKTAGRRCAALSIGALLALSTINIGVTTSPVHAASPESISTQASTAQPPVNVTASAHKTTVSVTWEPPTSGRRPNYYHVELIKWEGEKATTYMTIRHTESAHASFRDVIPGQYSVRVYNHPDYYETSQPGESEKFSITADVRVPSKVEAPDVSLLLNSTVKVEWSRPQDTGGLSLISYDVVLTPTDGSTPITKHIENVHAETSVTIDNLTRGKTYKATVVSRNNLGASDPSDPSDPITLSEDPTGPKITVSPLKVDPSKNTTFTVSGVGFTGEAASQGIYILVWPNTKWAPGHRPVPWTGSSPEPASRSFEVRPEEITNGTFNKTITVDSSDWTLRAGVKYYVGTAAAKEKLRTDRRLDVGELVQITPMQPTSVSLKANENRSLTVSWTPSNRDGRITNYDISLYRMENGSKVFVNKLARGSRVTEATFNNRHTPGTYVAEVTAGILRDDHVNSDYSAPASSQEVVIEKPRVTPPGAPTGIYLIAGESETALTAWWLPPADEGNGRITSYTLTLTPSDGSAPKVVSGVPESKSSHLVEGLKPGTTYTLTVQAVNEAGAGPASAPATATTPGKAPAPEPKPQPNPQITFSPSTALNTRVDNTLSVNGSGYVGAGATAGVKLAVVESTQWQPGQVPGDTLANKALASTSATPSASGELKASLTIPAGRMDPAKKYILITYSADLSNRTLDQAALLSLQSAEIAQPKLTVEPSSIDPNVDNTVRVTGTGYVGDGAASGVYVAVYRSSDFTPGVSVPEGNKALVAKWVRPEQVRGGKFTYDLFIPANTLSAGESYNVTTFAAHALSQTNRTLDAIFPLTLGKTPAPQPNPQPTPQPENPSPVLPTAGNSWVIDGKEFKYGRVSDEILVGDWDGNGTETPAIRRGNRLFVTNTIHGGNADHVFTFGRVGDQILVGDWNGDGRDTVAVRRGNQIFVKNSLTSGNADTVFYYGKASDTTLVGDFDGDGKDSVGIVRAGTAYIKNGLTSGNADITYRVPQNAVPLAGKWSASQKADTISVVDSEGSLRINTSTDSFTESRSVKVGKAPRYIAGDFDGDGVDTVALHG